MAKRYGAAGALKDTGAGTQLDRKLHQAVLGAGEEGVATRVLGPEGVSVRKHFYPVGKGPLASPAMQEEKAKILREGKIPGLPKLYGEAKTPGGEYMHRLEEFKGKTPSLGKDRRGNIQVDPALWNDPERMRTFRKAQYAAQGQGVDLIDVANNPGNMIKTDKGWKVLDFMPGQTDEAIGKPYWKHWLEVGVKGRDPVIPGLHGFFPAGYNEAESEALSKGKPGALDLTKRLGAGSRQEKKVRGAKEVAEKNILGRPVFQPGTHRFPYTPPVTPPTGTPHIPAPSAVAQTEGYLSRAGKFLTPRNIGIGAVGLGGLAAAGYGLHQYLNRPQQQATV